MDIFAYIIADASIPVTNLVPPALDALWELTAALQWSANIKYADASGRNDQSPTFTGMSDVWSPIPIDFQGICMGGTLTVTVTATIADKISGAVDRVNWSYEGQILGTNPSVPTVKTRLGDIKSLVIGYKESLPKWTQFYMSGANTGLPISDSQWGYGIMQLTSPAPTSDQVWNWQQNVDAGKAHYLAGIPVVQNHYNNLITQYPTLPAVDDVSLQKSYYQYYNTGFYLIPNADYSGWIVNPQYHSYGDDAYCIELNVNSGNPPPGWS